MTGNRIADKSIFDNKGFSLVELIICIAILAIAAVPLLGAFSTSGRVIGQAQSMQNATSVAEAVMEEVKGSTIQQLKDHSDYGFVVDPGLSFSNFMSKSDSDKIKVGSDNLGTNKAVLIQGGDNPFYVFYKAAVKADADEASADGELFDAVVTIDATENYVGTVGETAIDANSIELPVVDRIDKGKHAAISKEINRLDTSAVETWKDNWRDKNHKDSTDATPLSKLKKEVIITIDDPVHDTDDSKHMTDVECYVRYYDASKSKFEDDEFHVSEKVYSGTFLGSRDSRVYVFYKTARQSIHTNNKKNSLSNTEEVIDHEDILIKSTSVDARPAKDPRLVYVILQEDESPYSTEDDGYYQLNSGKTNLTITADDGIYKKTASANSHLTDDGVLEVPESATDKTLKVITNLPNGTGKRQPFYHNEKDDYIYAVDVFVYDKNKTEKVHLSSTKDAQLTTTPTPTPSVTVTPP